MKNPLGLFLTSAALALTIQAETVVLTPSADVTIASLTPNANLGAETLLRVGQLEEDESRVLLRFDVGGFIPPGSTITEVTLTVDRSVDPNAASPSNSLAIHRVLQFWNEGRGISGAETPVDLHETTWSHRVHPAVRWARAGAARAFDFRGRASAVVPASEDSLITIPTNARLVADVQSWLDYPYANEGWILIARSSSPTPTGFGSRESTSAAPQLSISYVAPGTEDSAASAEYEVVFRATWTEESHPRQFPASAHWSSLVGGLHHSGVTFWRRHSTASEGIRRMAEVGAQSTLLTEVNNAIEAGTANRTLSGSGISTGAGRTALRFTIDRTHPLVTLTSMVAPSPDWFVGVRNLPLLERGRWVSRKSVLLFPYDSGTDSGVTFNSPNFVTDPRSVISRIATTPLANSRGTTRPMGVMTFRRLDAVKAK